MREIRDDQRRVRMARRDHLAPAERVDDVTRIVDDLVALHATDASTVHLSAALPRSTSAT